MRINIDASSLQYTHCFRRFYNKIVLGHSDHALPLNDIEYGSAWHHFRETLARTKDPMLAMQEGNKYFAARMAEGMIFKEKKEHLNLNHLSQLFVRYYTEFGVEKSWGRYEYIKHPITGLPLVEQTFDIKFLEIGDFQFYLQGTMDGILLHPAGYVFFDDDKTTGEWNTKKFLEAFRLKPQLLFYRLGLELLSELPDGEWFKSLFEKRIGAKINAVFLKPEVDKVTFEQSRVFFFEDWEVQDMRAMLFKLCYRIENIISMTYLPEREGTFNDTCSGKYGIPCEFSGACGAPNEDIYEKILANFPVKLYEPLNFRKLS